MQMGSDKFVSLSDDTKVSGHTWFEIREKMMQPNYVKESEFAKLLTCEEKKTLTDLIAAQKAQGDLE